MATTSPLDKDPDIPPVVENSFTTTITATGSETVTGVVSSRPTSDSDDSTSSSFPSTGTNQSSTPPSSSPTDVSSLSSSSSSSISTTTQTVSWGPAITASPLSTGNNGAHAETSTPRPVGTGSEAFTKGQRDAMIASTVTGGVLVLALLIYAIFRRRRGATMSEIVRFRHHPPSTIILTPTTPPDMRLTALPILREYRYSVRSSMHASQVSVPKTPKQNASVPSGIAKRFHQQNPYIKNDWKSINPPLTPRTPPAKAQTFLNDASPSPPKVDIQLPEPTLIGRRQSRNRLRKHNSTATLKKTMSISVQPSSPTSKEEDLLSPPDSPTSQRALGERWSWTNSNAPPTPRHAPSLRSSISTISRMRNFKTWARGKSERIPEEVRPITSATTKRLVLKNQAMKPHLAPTASSSATSHPHDSLGSLSPVFGKQASATVIESPDTGT
ncbi:hypothetical protein M433DRAFT_145536 [Acidomyces richmondensis BFW]|nr:MAG: hypothetical protein FE78DRAFT_82274 [Acidomyces sp. 'richmondensis']KYG43768.1 hypothetical protein M433DRAFT_145536 [Acidomyces richmondensis BFW]